MRANGAPPFALIPSPNVNHTLHFRGESMVSLIAARKKRAYNAYGGEKSMIGENIQFLRKEKNMTQEALAEEVGVSRQTIAKWESGESAPDLDMAERLSQVLDASLDELAHAPFDRMPDREKRPGGKHIFGLVTVGEKGQIVIPVQARRVFNIKPGDQWMVLGDENQGLALMDARFFLKVAEVMEHDGK